MKNNKTCHLYTYVFLLVLSFFLFTFNVNADTYNVSISNSDYDFLASSDFITFRQAVLEKIADTSNSYEYYIISLDQGFDDNDNPVWTPNLRNLRVNFYSSLPNLTYSYYTERFNFSILNQQRSQFIYLNRRLTANGTFPNFWANIYYSNNIYSSFNYIDSNFSLFYGGNDILNINSSHYSYTLENGGIIFSLYYLYTHENEPPDNTPVLTDFYSLIIDKFSIIADFFTDNTYLFAIPLIPIIILCIYFIKRSLIK